MNVEVLYRPSYSIAKVALEPGETINAESGAMVSMSADVQVETGTRGGFLKSLARSALGGESFFINKFTAGGQGGEIMLAPPLPGDVQAVDLANASLMVQSGSFLASSEGVEVDTKWGGAKTFFAREGLFMLRCQGQGDLVMASYGAMHEIQLAEGESTTVDTGHLVAFTEGMQFDVRRVGGLRSTLFSGEGLVVDLTGPGTITLQTRSEDAFLSWLIPKIPKRSDSD